MDPATAEEKMEAICAEHAAATAAADAARQTAALRDMRRLFWKAFPARRKVAALHPAAQYKRHDITVAPFADLEAAMRHDINEARRLVKAAADACPYKACQTRFRKPMRIGGKMEGSETIADAIANGVLDFSAIATRGDAELPPGVIEVLPPSSAASPWHGPPGAFRPTGGVYSHTERPGFYFIPNSFTFEQQEHWCRVILRQYVEPPNRRNIDLARDVDYSFVERFGNTATPQAKTSTSSTAADDAGGAERAYGGAESAETSGGSRPVFETDLWKRHLAAEAATEAQATAAASTAPEVATEAAVAGSEAATPPLASDPLMKVSWATLGYQYDWSARQYHVPGDPDYHLHEHSYDKDEEEQAATPEGGGGGPSARRAPGRWYAPMPSEIAALAGDIAAAVDAAACAYPPWAQETSGAAGEARGLPMSLAGQSGIVNLYTGTGGIPMGCHVDDMERTFCHPVVSLSFGRAAVFLLGGASKDVPPLPILIRSGDILILSGACRLAMHGVARIFESSTPPELFRGEHSADTEAAPAVPAGSPGAPGDAAEEAGFRRYTTAARININIRQVF